MIMYPRIDYGNLFALKLPSIDTFTQEIINTDNDPVLFNVDNVERLETFQWTQLIALSLDLKSAINFFWINRWRSAGSMGLLRTS